MNMGKQQDLFDEWAIQCERLVCLRAVIQNDFELVTKEDIKDRRKNFLSQYKDQINIMSRLAGEIGERLKELGHIEGEICSSCEGDGCSDCCPCPTCGSSGECPTCNGQCSWYPKLEVK